MSPTLFRYLFRDLLRVFLLATLCLAGIMSFGGLLRPLTEHGLDARQVFQMLFYFLPAMTAYSLPIAALFATTFVYGRLAGDNELTACRAAGISHLSLTLPALLLGLGVTALSLALLLFLVPHFTLKIERVIYADLARLAARQIERKHRITLSQGDAPVTIFAQQARVLPSPADRPGDQVLHLTGPMIVTYPQARRGAPVVPPQDFYLARAATAVIRQDLADGDIALHVRLDGGQKLPRDLRGGEQAAVQVAIGASEFRSPDIESPIRENTKFMDVRRLRELLDRPESSRRVGRLVRQFVLADQRQTYLQAVHDALLNGGRYLFVASGERYELLRGPADVRAAEDRLVLESPDPALGIRFRQIDGGAVSLDMQARQVRVLVYPDNGQRRLDIDVELIDATVRTGAAETARASFTRSFSVAMPDAILEMARTRTAGFYAGSDLLPGLRLRLSRELLRLGNSVVSELHARASFAVTSLVLVLIGCGLGMLARSGTPLSAFAVSVVPAVLCVVLIVTGQHTAENVPITPTGLKDSLALGLGLIWGGNALVLSAAGALLWKMNRS